MDMFGSPARTVSSLAWNRSKISLVMASISILADIQMLYLMRQKFTPPEGPYLPPLITLFLYGCHWSRVETKTLECVWRVKGYTNKEFSRFLRLTIVENAR